MRAHPSVMVSSPAQLARLPDTLDWSRLSAGLRAVFSSGGPLPGTASDAVSRMWRQTRSEEHTSELQSLMRLSYAVFCLQKTNKPTPPSQTHHTHTHIPP